MTSTTRTSLLGSAATLVLCVALASCSGATGGTPSSGNMRGAVLASLGENVVMPAQEGFGMEIAALEAALAAAVDGSGTREMAQAAWRQAMMAWERVELMQVGPAGSSLD
ncbi:MAG: imelysin family protein, partial [Myxococcota bacterium]